jgi:hypothetical protein
MKSTVEPKHSLQAHKYLLKQFWDVYGNHQNGNLTSRKAPSPKGREAVLNALVDLGKVRLLYNSTHDRNNFEKRKKTVKAFNNFKKCFACKEPASVRHHIIWLKNGGRNQKNNIVGLCHPCHKEIHHWL